jgi:hypothetical protein
MQLLVGECAQRVVDGIVCNRGFFYYESLKEEGIDIFICNNVAMGIFI